MKTNPLPFIALLCYFQVPLFAQLSIEDHLGMENINQPQVFDGQHEFSNREIGRWEYRHLLIDTPEAYRKASPIFQVKKAETPLLILHGANDTRSPTLQAWEMYRAMQDAQKTVKMMIYPRAGHNISNPVQRKSVLNQWLQWSDDHLGRNN